MSKYKISVITIVRNDSEGFLITSRSVLRQQYTNYEWIVIDGLSTDGTSRYVKSLSKKNSKLLIEKDDGIYNAMNKGISLATGDWIIFMNAGDVFFNDATMSDFAENLMSTDDIVYTDVVRREDKKIHIYPPYNQFWAGMICDHQSMCIRSEIYKRLKYDETYKIAGDFDFLSRARMQGYNIRKIPGMIGARKPFSVGASSSFVERQIERIRVIKKYFDDYPWRALLSTEFTAARDRKIISNDEYEKLFCLLREEKN